MPVDPSNWSTLHDLGLIYLALAHGADADLVQPEKREMALKLHEWNVDVDDGPAVDEVMHEVMLTYMSDKSDHMIESAVLSVAQSMPKPLRIAILNDLADMASADGQVIASEVTFIQHLAQAWGVEEDDVE